MNVIHHAIAIVVLVVLAVLAMALLFAPALPAQTIYIYTDEDGVTHFTDRQPTDDREVTIQRAVAEPFNPLQMENRGSEREPEWTFSNRMHGPLQVEVTLDEPENLITEPELPARFVLGALESRAPILVGPLDPRQPWRYRIRSRAVPGDPEAAHRDDYPYRPPFAPGQRFAVSQAFGGSFSHSDPHSYHAVDITMPVGTPVHAARAGTVMDVARFFHGAGSDRERYGDRANFVRIEHDDGTMAVYAHLDYEGASVRPGQAVRKGQKIGRSGKTGFTTGPHLHFVVQRNAGMALESVPFRFTGADGEAVTPRPGLQLRAPD